MRATVCDAESGRHIYIVQPLLNLKQCHNEELDHCSMIHVESGFTEESRRQVQKQVFMLLFAERCLPTYIYLLSFLFFSSVS